MSLITFNECVGDCSVFGKYFNPIPCEIISLSIGIFAMIGILYTIYFLIKFIYEWFPN